MRSTAAPQTRQAPTATLETAPPRLPADRARALTISRTRSGPRRPGGRSCRRRLNPGSGSPFRAGAMEGHHAGVTEGHHSRDHERPWVMCSSRTCGSTGPKALCPKTQWPTASRRPCGPARRRSGRLDAHCPQGGNLTARMGNWLTPNPPEVGNGMTVDRSGPRHGSSGSSRRRWAGGPAPDCRSCARCCNGPPRRGSHPQWTGWRPSPPWSCSSSPAPRGRSAPATWSTTLRPSVTDQFETGLAAGTARRRRQGELEPTSRAGRATGRNRVSRRWPTRGA